MSEPKELRIPVMMARGEVAAIDNWRRNQRDLPGRSEAIRRLIEIGLTAEPHLRELLAYLERAGDPGDREVKKAVAELRKALGEA